MNFRSKHRSIAVFNSALENGLRSLIVVVANQHRHHDLDRLVLLDYLLVHSGDFDAAVPSLHPQVPCRFGEVFIRRPLVESGIQFMVNRGLVLQEFTAEGRLFFASGKAGMFLDSLSAPYIQHLRERATWGAERFGKLPTTALEAEFREHVTMFGAIRIERWESGNGS